MKKVKKSSGNCKLCKIKFLATERILQMAQPKKISDKSKDDEDFNPWAISKNALKYKPTPRILELSKPIERS